MEEVQAAADRMSSPPSSADKTAFDRIRAEYVTSPNLRLTPEQVHRLTGTDVSICRVVLDDLVRAKFLHRAPDGTYVRVLTK